MLFVIITATTKMWALGLSIIFIFWALEAGAVKMKKDKPRRLTLKQQMEKFRKKMSIPGYRAPWLVNRSVQDQGHVSSSPVFGPRGLLTQHRVTPPSRPTLGIVHVDSSSDEDPDPFGVFLHTDSAGPDGVGNAASSNGLISSEPIPSPHDIDEGDPLLELHCASQNSVASTLIDSSPSKSVHGASHHATASSAATSGQACGPLQVTSSNAGRQTCGAGPHQVTSTASAGGGASSSHAISDGGPTNGGDATPAVGASPPPPEHRSLHGSPCADPNALAIIHNDDDGEKKPLSEKDYEAMLDDGWDADRLSPDWRRRHKWYMMTFHRQKPP